jgi:hypothetical protein
MHNKHLFEYAVLRVVPQVEREEFLNVGVILYCRKPAFLGVRFALDTEKLAYVFPTLCLDTAMAHLQSLQNISDGLPSGGAIALLDAASRFRWLTAKRSTVIQSSPVHPGLSEHPAATLDALFAALV